MPDVPENGAEVPLLLGPAVVARRRVEARLHGRRLDAGRVGRRLVPRRQQQPRLHPGEAVPDVSHGGPAAHHRHVAVALQEHLHHRLLVVRVVPAADVDGLQHADGLAGHGRVLVVHGLELLGVLRVLRADEHRLGRRPRRSLMEDARGRVHLRQDLLLARACRDLLEVLLERHGVPGEGGDLQTDLFLEAGHVRRVVARDELPHLVGRVEEVPPDVVERRVARREHPPELLLELRHQEQPRGEVEVGAQDHPVDIAEDGLVLVAEEELLRLLVVVLQVDVRVRRQRLRPQVVVLVVLGGPDEVPVAAVAAAAEPLDAVGEEAPGGELPRGAREGLAEEAGHVVGELQEEDAAGEQRVEEGGRDGEHAVADVAGGGRPHEVAALHQAHAVRGRELHQRLLVGERARAALAVERLVLAQPGSQVRRRRVRRRPAAVEGRRVPAQAGPLADVRRQEAAEQPVPARRRRVRRL
uniref:Uncharacterized protein n=1 Tax=Aegilops tauschii subsp. strangulata TaxID=200361 RepID=A0A453KZ65_AEGTS